MIKFFRSFRKNLLAENRTGKYLKYAIGEIVLVVIGILIALQINTWSIEQDNHKMEKTYLQALLFEVNDDLQFYSNVVDTLSTQQKSAEHILYFLEQPEADIKDSLYFLQAFRNCADGENLTRTAVSWNELQSTGRLSLIRNKELTRQLFEYYDFLDQFAFDFNKFPMEERYMVRKLEHDAFNTAEHKEFFQNMRQEKIPRKTVYNNIRNNQDILAHVKSVMISAMVQRKTALNALDRANKLHETIVQELE
jgi:hypothetical protein